MWSWLYRNKPDAGLDEATAAADRADRDLEFLIERRGMIRRLTADLREKREQNHFAQLITESYASRRGGG